MTLAIQELRTKEISAPNETITGRDIIQAMDGIFKYSMLPDTPLSMHQRTIDIGRDVHSILGPGTGIYATGYPFSGGLNLLFDSNDPPSVFELERYLAEQRNRAHQLLEEKASKPYHCLSSGVMPEHEMLGVGGGGNDYTEQIYRCPHCSPSLQQLCAPIPDIDVFAVVDKYPKPEVLKMIDEAGQRKKLFSKYLNVPGIMRAFANLDNSPPPLAIDFVIVERDDIAQRLSSVRDDEWINLKTPCQMIRHGTQTFRPDFLDLGKDLVMSLQPIWQDQQIHTLIETAISRLLHDNNSDDLLTSFCAKAKASNLRLYTDPVIQRSVKLRHDLIRREGLKSLI